MPNVKIRPHTLRDMSTNELKSTLEEQRSQLMLEKTRGSVVAQSSTKRGKESPGVMGELKKNIARIKTVLRERELDE